MSTVEQRHTEHHIQALKRRMGSIEELARDALESLRKDDVATARMLVAACIDIASKTELRLP